MKQDSTTGMTFFILGMMWFTLSFATEGASTVYLIMGFSFLCIGFALTPWDQVFKKEEPGQNEEEKSEDQDSSEKDSKTDL